MGAGLVASGELLGGGGDRGLLEGVIEQIQSALENLSAYPRWLVATCGVIVALAVLYILGKVLKWTIYLMVAGAAIAVVLGGVYWWMGRI